MVVNNTSSSRGQVQFPVPTSGNSQPPFQLKGLGFSPLASKAQHSSAYAHTQILIPQVISNDGLQGICQSFIPIVSASSGFRNRQPRAERCKSNQYCSHQGMNGSQGSHCTAGYLKSAIVSEDFLVHKFPVERKQLFLFKGNILS